MEALKTNQPKMNEKKTEKRSAPVTTTKAWLPDVPIKIKRRDNPNHQARRRLPLAVRWPEESWYALLPPKQEPLSFASLNFGELTHEETLQISTDHAAEEKRKDEEEIKNLENGIYDDGTVSLRITDTTHATMTIKPATIPIGVTTGTTAGTKNASMIGPLTIDLRTGNVYDGEDTYPISPLTDLKAKFVPRLPSDLQPYEEYERIGRPSFLCEVQATTDLIGELIHRMYPRRRGPDKLRCHLDFDCQTSSQLMLCGAPPTAIGNVPGRATFIGIDTEDHDEGRLSLICMDLLSNGDVFEDCRHPDGANDPCICFKKYGDPVPFLYMDVVFTSRHHGEEKLNCLDWLA